MLMGFLGSFFDTNIFLTLSTMVDKHHEPVCGQELLISHHGSLFGQIQGWKANYEANWKKPLRKRRGLFVCVFST